jgi:hypothetical protein
MVLLLHFALAGEDEPVLKPALVYELPAIERWEVRSIEEALIWGTSYQETPEQQSPQTTFVPN